MPGLVAHKGEGTGALEASTTEVSTTAVLQQHGDRLAIAVLLF